MEQYRGRGIYLPTHKESYITTVWRKTREEAEEDIKVYGHNYTGCYIRVKEVK